MSVKDDFRAKSLRNLKNKSKISAKCAHYKMLNSLQRLMEFKKIKHAMIYMPLKYEPNVCKIRHNLRKKAKFYLPFMVGLSLKMVRYQMPFYTGKFCLRTPTCEREYKGRVDMVVVPCVGVDGAMKRIGHGAGYYDRFFDDLAYRPLVVFIQIDENFSSQKIGESHDISCDYYLTPKRNYVKRGIDDRDYSRLRSRCGGRWRRVFVCEKDKRR